MRLLVVEDEPVLADATVEALRSESYAVDLAMDGGTAEELMAVNEYDLVVLDWTIPPPTGVELLEAWRAAGLQLPILMLTGRGSVDDRVDGLDRGADDYLTKPFSLAELTARIRSLLRRRDRDLRPALCADDLSMDRATRRVVLGDAELDLTPKEFSVLEYLLTRPDEVVSRTELIEHVWDQSFDSMSNVVDVVMHRLRKKIDLGRDEVLLKTVPSVGYTLRSRRAP